MNINISEELAALNFRTDVISISKWQSYSERTLQGMDKRLLQLPRENLFYSCYKVVLSLPHINWSLVLGLKCYASIKFSGTITDKVMVMLGNWDSWFLLGTILWSAQLRGSMAKSFIFSKVMCLCLGTAQYPVVLVLWVLSLKVKWHKSWPFTFYQVPGLRMCDTVLPLLHMPSWHVRD